MSADKVYGKLFLSVGAMKAGTTWLYSLLCRHPQLHFSLEKEPHYLHDAYLRTRGLNRFRGRRHLSHETRARKVRDTYLPRIRPERDTPEMIAGKHAAIRHYLSDPVDDAWYRGLFQEAPEGAYHCDFSNLTGLLSPKHWREIAGKCTDLRVMYTMRDPVERLWSHAKFELEHSGRAAAVDGWGAEQYVKLLRNPTIRAQSEYGKVIRSLRAALPDEAQLLMFYEDIHADRLGALRRIEAFLGIKPCDYPDILFDRRQASSMKRDMPAFFPELVADDAARIKGELEALGLTVPASWR